MVDSAYRVRALYRHLLRQSNRFAVYNFREYARRRIRDEFHSNKDVGDPTVTQMLLESGKKDLLLLQRQTMLSRFFQLDHLVVEGKTNGKQSARQAKIARLNDFGCD